MTEQLYRLFTGVVMTARELDESKFCFHPTPKPENSDAPEGMWYCGNPDCVVRESIIRCKLHGEKLPEMKCPACSSPLKFHNWIGYETLEAIKMEDEPN